MDRPRLMVVACVTTMLATTSFSVPGQTAAPSTPARIRGFSAAGGAVEKARERDFLAMPSARANEADFDVMTAAPHHLGSPYEIALADYVARQYASFGLDVSRYEYSVAVPQPGERHVEIIAPDRVTLQVEEDTIPGDRWAAMPGILPAPKVAGEHGAIGCLVYSDPHEDGYFRGDAYPAGGLSWPGDGSARHRARHRPVSG